MSYTYTSTLGSTLESVTTEIPINYPTHSLIRPRMIGETLLACTLLVPGISHSYASHGVDKSVERAVYQYPIFRENDDNPEKHYSTKRLNLRGTISVSSAGTTEDTLAVVNSAGEKLLLRFPKW